MLIAYKTSEDYCARSRVIEHCHQLLVKSNWSGWRRCLSKYLELEPLYSGMNALLSDIMKEWVTVPELHSVADESR